MKEIDLRIGIVLAARLAASTTPHDILRLSIGN